MHRTQRSGKHVPNPQIGNKCTGQVFCTTYVYSNYRKMKQTLTVTNMWTRDVTKFAFEFDNVRTSNVFSRFEIRRIFSCTRRRIRTSGLHDRYHMSTPTGHWNNQLNKCTLPNSLKRPKIILDMADSHVSKDGPFRILGNALTYLLSDFFGVTFLHFLS